MGAVRVSPRKMAAAPVVGRDAVFALAPGVEIPQVVAGVERVQSPGATSVSSMTAEERLLLGMVDGRRSVSHLARASGLPEVAVCQSFGSLRARRIVVPVKPTVVTIEGASGEPVYRLGNYEIGARVGQGGMGAVYVSRRTGASGFRRLFALKVVRQEPGREPMALQSFVRELRVGQLLHHPHIQSVVDVGMHNDEPFLVLDYVEGTDLEELAAFVGGPLDPAIAVAVMVDVLRGLQRVHDTVDGNGEWLGLVHGDVSLSNILVGVDGVTKLADFGSARFVALGETGRSESMTLGKPAYMSPERLRREDFDGGADLFALGVVMWTVLTGRELFGAATNEEIVRNVCDKDIEPPSTYGSPAVLDEICLRAVSRQGEGRYATADELARDLLRVAVANGLLASPSDVGRYVRQHLGASLVERQNQIRAGFRSVERPAVAAGPVSRSGDSSAVPSVQRKPTAPTIVLPLEEPESAAPAAATPARRSKRAGFGATRGQLYLLVVLAVIVSALVVMVDIFPLPRGRAQRNPSPPAPRVAIASQQSMGEQR